MPCRPGLVWRLDPGVSCLRPSNEKGTPASLCLQLWHRAFHQAWEPGGVGVGGAQSAQAVSSGAGHRVLTGLQARGA